jgi:hypothetical protein
MANDNKNLKVQFSKNVGTFKYHEVNRDFLNRISQSRINRIAESMINDGLKPIPIIVTSKFYVVDGQHRLEAAKIAGKGIYFIIDTSIPNTAKGIFEAARSMNQNSKEWSKKDYIHGFSEMGKESYTTLEKFGEKFPMFSLTERIMLLQNSGTKHANKADFANGEFDVVDVNKAELWANNLLSLKEYFPQGYNKSVFVRTLLTIMEKKTEFSFDEFLRKVQLRPGSIYLCGDKRSYAEMIEEIYNYKRPNEKKLNLRY